MRDIKGENAFRKDSFHLQGQGRKRGWGATTKTNWGQEWKKAIDVTTFFFQPPTEKRKHRRARNSNPIGRKALF